jgi:hypothetical protein
MTKTADVTVLPLPNLVRFSADPPTLFVTGGTAWTGKVTLDGPAPAGGVVITLVSNSPITAPVPLSVVVPAGQTTVNFTATTKSVERPHNTFVEATYAKPGLEGGLQTKKILLIIVPEDFKPPFKGPLPDDPGSPRS